MSTIKITDLKNSGFDLFADSETYLNELEDSFVAADRIKGGQIPFSIISSSPVIVTTTIPLTSVIRIPLR